MKKLLKLLESDCSATPEQLAVSTGMTVEFWSESVSLSDCGRLRDCFSWAIRV